MNIDKYEKTIQEWRFIPMANYICPTYKVTRNESNSPRGLTLLLHLIHTKRRDFNEVVAERMYQCTSCSLCTIHGFDETDPALLFIAARADVVEKGLTPKPIIKYKNMLQRKDLVNPKQFKNFNKNAKLGIYIDPFNLNSWPDLIDLNLKLLDKAGLDYSILGLGKGSGARLFEIGFRGLAKDIAKDTITNIKNLGLETIICLSPYDYKAFTEWYRELGLVFSNKIKFVPFPAFMLDLIKKGNISFKNNKHLKVTYHDSGNFVRAKQNFLEIDKIFNKIPNVEFIPMWRNGQKSSCDGGDFLPYVYPEIANAISQKKYEEAKETNAEVLLTSCFYAYDNLTKIASKDGLKLMDLGEFLFNFLS